MKHYLRFMLVLLLSTVWCVGGYAQTVSKVTDISNIVSGQKYYIGATIGSTDYYLSLASTSLSESVKGTGIVDKTKANTFIFDGSSKSWTIKIDGTDFYLSLKTTKDNGNVQVVKSAVTFTLSNQNELIRITKGSFSIQKNKNAGTTNFGSYANSQKDVWLEPVETSSNKTKTTLTFPQESFSFATTDDLTSFKGQTATLKAEGADMTGKTITYSKTGDDIFTSFDETTGALVLNGKAGTATVKANFAGDDTYASSTASYTVTVDQVFADLASLKAAIPSKANSVSTAVPFRLKLTDALVTYVNGKKAYVQDATTGVLLFDNESSGNAFELVAGQKFTGFVDVKACWFNGMAEVTAWTPAADVVKEENVDIPVKTVTLAELKGVDYSKYECVRVKVENATVSTAYSTAKKATIKQGDETYLIHGEVSGLDVNKDDVCDFIGYPIYWKTRSSDEYQLSVWSQDDIIVKSSVVKTTISFDPATTEYNVDNNNKDTFKAPTATVKDAEGNIVEGAAITYISSVPGVATVGETDGKVTFVGFGTTVITASYAGDDTHMPSKNSYSINYGKIKSTMAWSATEVTANLGEEFTAPTLSLTADNVSILEGKTITYRSTDENVAAFVDGTLVIGDEGTTTITATFAGDDTYAEASAEYTLTVKDPNKLEVTFDFVNNKYGYGTGQVPEGAKITSSDVTITHVKNGTQNKTAFYGDSFRVYYGSQLNISVAAGYYMTKIVFDNITANTFSCTPGTLNGKVWEGTASSIDLDVKGTNKFKTITVSYAKYPEVVVDENATQDDMLNLIIYNKDKVVNAKLNRTLIADGGWYTFSVPFDVKDVNSTALSGAEIRKYKSMNGSIMEFEATTELKAGHAYLVKPSVDITTPIFNSVTLSKGDTSKDGENGYEFIATLGSKELKTDGTNLFLGADNKFYIPTETGKIMKALRGYFVAPSGESGSKMGINIDGETNYITTLNGSAVVYGKVYNLNGQYVGNDVKSLKKGVYVVNGRKFIVK